MAGAFNAAGLALNSQQGQFLLDSGIAISREYTMQDDPDMQLMRELQASGPAAIMDESNAYPTLDVEGDLDMSEPDDGVSTKAEYTPLQVLQDGNETKRSYSGSPKPVNLDYVNAMLIQREQTTSQSVASSEAGDDHGPNWDSGSTTHEETGDAHGKGCIGATSASTPSNEPDSGSSTPPKTSKSDIDSPTTRTPSEKDRKQQEKAPSLISLLATSVDQTVGSIFKLGDVPVEQRADWKLHVRAAKLVPHSISAHRYWIAVLMHDISLKDARKENNFLWLKGNRVSPPVDH